ncbi:TPA: LysM peptidoglycan-binding domain-containing protein [Streptococcus suis]|nr:LysM peptidoglycan-binding domain-containing protein [Streptococcus suis]HEM2547777.1 LysM peptidoglycan-binding domain-containing protein [Streptococcus suis]
MSQEPWNEEVYQTDAVSRKDRFEKNIASTKIFTVLAIIFFLIVLIIGITAVYLSVGGSKTDSTKEFYNPSSAAVVAESVASTTEEATSTVEEIVEESTETAQSSSTVAEATDGSTITVQAGEGVGALAARGGISIAELERLNPEKMTTGSWLAHPGDVVRIR